jgi:threonine dehydratase
MTEQHLLDPMRKPSREGILRAMIKIAKIIPPTPLLSLEVDGQTIWCKAEMLQPIGAFKIRGAWHRLSDMNERERALGVVGVSSGNHAQGVAWAAKRLGITAVIVMPENAPKAKIAATQALGAKVVFYKRPDEDRDAIAAKLVQETGGTLVHAFADPWVIEGQGTMGLEATEQLKAIGIGEPTQIIACCGGGGLSSGLAIACPNAEIYAVEPEGWDDVGRSLLAGEILAVDNLSYPTECDALQTPKTFPINFEILKARNVTGVVVTNAEVRAAMKLAYEKLHLVLEPGGAAALAAVIAGKVELSSVPLVTLSGGNVDTEKFAAIITG